MWQGSMGSWREWRNEHDGGAGDGRQRGQDETGGERGIRRQIIYNDVRYSFNRGC